MTRFTLALALTGLNLAVFGSNLEKQYLLIEPQTDTITGVIIRDYSKLPDTTRQSPYQFNKICSTNGLAILYTTTSDRFPELYYFDEEMARLDSIVNYACDKHILPKNKLVIGGISASGTRALRFAQYCASGKSKFKTKINGVFSVDSPLDLERFYRSATTNYSTFKAGMKSEAELMQKRFPEYLEHPDISFTAYRRSSVYSQFAEDGGNVKWLKSTPVIFFHEPDIDWWMKERGASYFDINSFDISACALKLKSMGNDDVTVITTSGKGFDHSGNRKCHSWTIVDEKLLVEWIVERLE